MDQPSNRPESREVPLPELTRASLESRERATLLFKTAIDDLPDPGDITLDPQVPIKQIKRDSFRRISLLGGPFDRKTLYRITLPDGKTYPLLPDGILNELRPSEPMGMRWQEDGTAVFRLFAPRAHAVELHLFERPDQDPVATLAMVEDAATGCWSMSTDRVKAGHLYGYYVVGPEDSDARDGMLFADPWGWATAKRTAWPRPSLTVVLPRDISSLPPLPHKTVPPRDLVIYEAHLKDVSRLSRSLPRSLRGTYPGVTAEGEDSFIRHLDRLRPTAIEWLPLQDYDYQEAPYDPNSTKNGWNRYERNHWGYMPAYYFSPEARYASDGGQGDVEGWIGVDGRQVRETREMVDRLHKAGFAVILDVVYNHIAQYGTNPIRQIDPYYALRHDRDGNRLGYSGCGNDLATERPMIRRLIVESLEHWLDFYGVDGFRFDLAGLLDQDTLDTISDQLRARYPDVHLIAEPWGGTYDKDRFTRRNWAAWNDLYRDGLRGFEPVQSGTWLFGKGASSVLRHVRGDRIEDGGPFLKEEHAVNYLACHDGYTLGDFIRIAAGDAFRNAPIGHDEVKTLSSTAEHLHRLALFMLFTSRGALMLHEGDEWARAKWVVDEGVEDALAGCLDRDSYNKDNATNWLDWKDLEIEANLDLVTYTAGLIRLRALHPALRVARLENHDVLRASLARCLAYRLSVPTDELIVIANADPSREVSVTLPPGRWIALATTREVNPEQGVTGALEKEVSIPARSGMLLVNSESLAH